MRWRPPAGGMALALALLGTAPGPLPARQDPAPGHLSNATLEARIGPGGAAVEVRLALDGVRGSVPLRVLAFGGIPEAVEGVWGDGAGVSLVLTEARPGLWTGRMPPPPGAGGAGGRRLTLRYRVPEPVLGVAGADEGELAIPWLLVPWAPSDGSPTRVRMQLHFPGPVLLTRSFPARLEAVDPDPAGAGGTWAVSLPVLPSFTRAGVLDPDRVVGMVPPGAAAPERLGPRRPPDAPRPGFVFGGLFLAFAAVVLGYAIWMRTRERRP